MQFFPSPDYLEAGKFKIQRSLNASRIVGSDIENVAQAKQLYRESYDQILAETKKSDITYMSYASIGAVTNLGKEMVQRILTDFF